MSHLLNETGTVHSLQPFNGKLPNLDFQMRFYISLFVI